MKVTALAAAAVLLPLAAGCTTPFAGRDCTTDVRPAVSVQLRDARSGAALTGPATATARDGTYLDTQEIGALDSDLRLAQERPGVYEVAVRKQGYREWTRAGVRVRDGECHVRTVKLVAELEPAA
ncbi:MAG: carboxypeptidase-like regulatory domain-containing protein [Gemmatimonadota bacterium]